METLLSIYEVVQTVLTIYFLFELLERRQWKYATPLDTWHLAQKFTSLPVLGDTFIQESPPVDRIVAVTTEPQFLFDGFIQLNCVRPMPVYSVPGMIDHF